MALEAGFEGCQASMACKSTRTNTAAGWAVQRGSSCSLRLTSSACAAGVRGRRGGTARRRGGQRSNRADTATVAQPTSEPLRQCTHTELRRPSASHVTPVYRQGGMEGSAPQPLRLLAAANWGQLVIASRMARSPASAAPQRVAGKRELK